jgi:Protein of unknown function (DUF2752)
MLLLSLVVIVAAFALEVLPDQRVALRGAQAAVLPPMCLTHELTGVDCPGCGLTRSFVHLAHGDWWESWHVHHLGWLLAAAVVLQVPYRVYCLRAGRQALPAWVGTWFGYVTIGLLLANWLVTRVLDWG